MYTIYRYNETLKVDFMEFYISYFELCHYAIGMQYN